MGEEVDRPLPASESELPPGFLDLLREHVDLLAFSLRARLARVVRERYPRDLRSWPLMGQFRFGCAYTSAYVAIQSVPTTGMTIGPEGGLWDVEGGFPSRPATDDDRRWNPWLDELRKFLRLPDEAGLFAIPIPVAKAEIEFAAANLRHPDCALLDLQVENNIAHHRRFLRIDTAAPEEWRGRPMSFTEAAPLFGLTGNALRKRCEGATESGSPYYPLRPRGPARLPNGKLREDAVRYVAEQVGRSKEVALKAIEERKRAITWGRTNNPISPGALEREGMRRLDQQP